MYILYYRSTSTSSIHVTCTDHVVIVDISRSNYLISARV